MHHAFISYARLDADFVEGVVALLEDQGREVWIDRRDIPVSFPWIVDVREAIAAADLLIEFRSSNQAVSQACALESAGAEELGKEIVGVEVGSASPEGATREIAAALDRLSKGDRDRTELLVRSGAWDRQGRPRRGLPSRRLTRRLGAAARAARRPMPAVAQHFLLAAQRRNRRRRVLTAIGVSIIGLSLITIALMPRIEKSEEQRLDEIERRFSDSRFADLETENNVYGVLEEGARKMATGSRNFLDMEPLQKALDVPVPDRVSTQSAGPAIIEAPVGSSPVAISPSGIRARGSRSSGSVSLWERDGKLARRIWAGTRPTALAFSPDERLIAVGEGERVGVFDLKSGELLEHLQGLRKTVTGLRWSRNGAYLWALTGSKVVRWSWRTARVLLDRPGLKFVDLAASQSSNQEIAVTKDGRIVLIDEGEPGRVMASGAQGASNAALSRNLVALSADSEVVIYDLSSGRERSIPLDCLTGGVAFSPNGKRLYATCVNEGVLVFETQTLRQLASIPVEGGALRLTPLPGGDLVVGSPQGFAFLIPHDGGEPEHLVDAMRGEALFAVAASPDGKRILLGGLGTGKPYSAFSGWQDSSGWHWDTMLDSGSAAGYAATSGAFSSDDRLMALGLKNGRILIRSLGKDLGIGPVWSDLPGAITGLAFNQKGGLTVTTSEGIVATYDDPCPDCEKPRALGKLAEDRYQRALRNHLVDPTQGDGWWSHWRRARAIVQSPSQKR